MRAVGFDVGKGFLRFAVVEGTLAAPVPGERDGFKHDPAEPLADRMAWFARHFDDVLGRVGAQRVAFRMHMGRGMTQDQIGVFHYPWGVLLQRCHALGLPVIEMTGSALTAKRFGLAKGEKPMELVDEILGGGKWDDHGRYAACAAWASLA